MTKPPLKSLVVSLFAAFACGGAGETPTFSGQVAEIVYEKCASCHRPDGAAPFALIEYEDVRMRADRIAEVVREGFMPPWPPANRNVAFADDRSLTEEQIETFERWAAAGAPLGVPESIPAPPSLDVEWPLGPPDLIVEAPEPYLLPAEGNDVYRNFVLSTPVTTTRYVQAIDLQPGSDRIVHHGILNVDRTGSARRWDARDPEPGFESMETGGAHPPDEQLVGWTPGRTPRMGDPDLAWRLTPGMDLVLQLHMLPSGEEVPIQPRVGLYFSDSPPTKQPVTVVLARQDMRIPAGEPAYRTHDRFDLPVDAHVLSVYPHAHYLGKDLRGYAVLADGSEVDLIHIPAWDFRWQDQYAFAEPVPLPAGSTIVMEYVYDNSADNPANPNSPPQEVRFGPSSLDEMAELNVLLLPDDPQDRWALVEARSRQAIGRNPNDWRALFSLAVAAQNRGRIVEAARHYESVIEINATYAPAYYSLAVIYLNRGDNEAAREYLLQTLALAPDFSDAYQNLGFIHNQAEEWAEAVRYYRRAAELSPEIARVHQGLGNALFGLGRYGEAIVEYERALQIDPSDAGTLNNLGNANLQLGYPERAVPFYREALRLAPDNNAARTNLQTALQQIAERS